MPLFMQAADWIKEMREVTEMGDLDFERVASAFKNHLRRIEVLEKLHYKDHPYPEDHNYPEPVHSKPKPHTCGECRRPWRKESDGGMIFMLACRHNKKPDKEVSWRSEDDEACSKFKSREESCT